MRSYPWRTIAFVSRSAAAVETLQHRAECLEGSLGDGIDDELDMAYPLVRVPPEAVGDGFRIALERWGIILASAAGTRQPHEHGGGAFDFAGIASDGSGGRVNFFAEGQDAFGTVACPAVPGVPRIDMRSGQRQHPIPHRTDHQPRSSWPGPRNEFAIPSRIELALEVDVAFPQECPDDGERFGKTRHSPVEGKAEGQIFGLVPSRAQSEDQPSTADLIHGRRHLGQHRRIVKAGAGNQWPDRDPAGRGGDAGEHGPRLPRPAGAMGFVAIKEMIAEPHGVETDLLAPSRHRGDFRPADFALHLGQLEADLERARGDYACLTW